MEILIALLAFLVVFALIVWAAARAFSWTLQRMVGDRHADLEEVLQTGCVPERWRQRRWKRLGAPGHQTHLKKLSRLQRYVQTTSLVENETARQDTLVRLSEVRASWQRWEERDGHRD